MSDVLPLAVGKPPREFTPSVALVTPHYGGVAMGLLNTLQYASLKGLVRTTLAVSNSVLPHAFNMLLGAALDERDRGKVTHLAMAHSDILAPPGWLDTLWGEMQAHDADLVSAVVPIKEASTRTSTAIGRADDRWAVERCLHLEDRDALPDTFGPEHVCRPGEVLLVNTGLFLADLRRPWWDEFAFTFHCRLRQTDAGRVAETRPEDWELSHHLHDAGARVRATWKVHLGHEGIYRWSNRLDAEPGE